MAIEFHPKRHLPTIQEMLRSLEGPCSPPDRRDMCAALNVSIASVNGLAITSSPDEGARAVTSTLSDHLGIEKIGRRREEWERASSRFHGELVKLLYPPILDSAPYWLRRNTTSLSVGIASHQVVTDQRKRCNDFRCRLSGGTRPRFGRSYG